MFTKLLHIADKEQREVGRWKTTIRNRLGPISLNIAVRQKEISRINEENLAFS